MAPFDPRTFYECPICGFSESSCGAFWEHIEEKHKEYHKKEMDKPKKDS